MAETDFVIEAEMVRNNPTQDSNKKDATLVESLLRDLCLGINDDNSSEEEEWSTEEEDVETKEERDANKEKVNNPFCPVIRISEEEVRNLCKPWKRSVIVKPLGKHFGLRFMRAALLKLWQPEGEIQVIDVGNDFFVVRFSQWNDAKRVITGVPWIILDHFLMVQKWHPMFSPTKHEFKRVAVWIRIPGLPIQYYDKDILKRIGNCTGKAVKVDSNSLLRRKKNEADNTLFVRMCVEVDLRKILLPYLELNNGRVCVEVDLGKALVPNFEPHDNTIYKVEYEGLHLVCFRCGRYGHHQNDCRLKTMPISTVKGFGSRV